MQLINYDLIRSPHNWIIIWAIAAFGALAVTAVRNGT